MTAIWKRNRDRRRARAAMRLMQHAEGQWRAEIERRISNVPNDNAFTDAPIKDYVWTLIAADDEDYQGPLYVSIGQ